jgi:hypothetical protein
MTGSKFSPEIPLGVLPLPSALATTISLLLKGDFCEMASLAKLVYERSLENEDIDLSRLVRLNAKKSLLFSEYSLLSWSVGDYNYYDGKSIRTPMIITTTGKIGKRL